MRQGKLHDIPQHAAPPGKRREKRSITMKTLAELEQEHGAVEYRGITYVLVEDAYYEHNGGNEYYQASAKRVPPIIDDDGGEVDCIVRWDILDDYEPNGDASDACDWNSPAGVHIDGYWLNGAYNQSQDI
jgi:hypothetical protein